MFTISVKTRFRASHQLVLSDEAKEQMHEHEWQVTADVSSERLNNSGLVMNFEQLKEMLETIVAGLCGSGLEKNSFFRETGSSAELVAQYIHQQLEPKLPADVKLKELTVVEKPGCTAKFFQTDQRSV